MRYTTLFISSVKFCEFCTSPFCTVSCSVISFSFDSFSVTEVFFKFESIIFVGRDVAMEGFFALYDVNGCILDVHNLEAKESFLIGNSTDTGSTILRLFKYVISCKLLFYIITHILHLFTPFYTLLKARTSFWSTLTDVPKCVAIWAGGKIACMQYCI